MKLFVLFLLVVGFNCDLFAKVGFFTANLENDVLDEENFKDMIIGWHIIEKYPQITIIKDKDLAEYKSYYAKPLKELNDVYIKHDPGFFINDYNIIFISLQEAKNQNFDKLKNFLANRGFECSDKNNIWGVKGDTICFLCAKKDEFTIAQNNVGHTKTLTKIFSNKGSSGQCLYKKNLKTGLCLLASHLDMKHYNIEEQIKEILYPNIKQVFAPDDDFITFVLGDLNTRMKMNFKDIGDKKNIPALSTIITKRLEGNVEDEFLNVKIDPEIEFPKMTWAPEKGDTEQSATVSKRNTVSRAIVADKDSINEIERNINTNDVVNQSNLVFKFFGNSQLRRLPFTYKLINIHKLIKDKKEGLIPKPNNHQTNQEQNTQAPQRKLINESGEKFSQIPNNEKPWSYDLTVESYDLSNILKSKKTRSEDPKFYLNLGWLDRMAVILNLKSQYTLEQLKKQISYVALPTGRKGDHLPIIGSLVIPLMPKYDYNAYSKKNLNAPKGFVADKKLEREKDREFKEYQENQRKIVEDNVKKTNEKLEYANKVLGNFNDVQKPNIDKDKKIYKLMENQRLLIDQKLNEANNKNKQVENAKFSDQKLKPGDGSGENGFFKLLDENVKPVQKPKAWTDKQKIGYLNKNENKNIASVQKLKEGEEKKKNENKNLASNEIPTTSYKERVLKPFYYLPKK